MSYSHPHDHAPARFKALEAFYAIMPPLAVALADPVVIAAAPLNHRANAVSAASRTIEKLERIEAKQPRRDGLYDIEWVYEDRSPLIGDEDDQDEARLDPAMHISDAPVDEADTRPSAPVLPVLPVANAAGKQSVPVAAVAKPATKLSARVGRPARIVGPVANADAASPAPVVGNAATTESAASAVDDDGPAVTIGGVAYREWYLDRMHDADRDPAMRIGTRRPTARAPDPP